MKSSKGTKMLKEFSDVTSIHGIPELMDHETTIFLRVIWACIFLTSLGLSVYQLIAITNSYRDRETVTSIYTGELKNLALSAVCTSMEINRESYVHLGEHGQLTNDGIDMIAKHFIPNDDLNAINGFQKWEKTYNEIMRTVNKGCPLKKILDHIVDMDIVMTSSCRSCKPPNGSRHEVKFDDFGPYRHLNVSTLMNDHERNKRYVCQYVYPGSYLKRSKHKKNYAEVDIHIRIMSGKSQPVCPGKGPVSEIVPCELKPVGYETKQFMLHLESSVHSIDSRVPVLRFSMDTITYLTVSAIRRIRLSTKRYPCSGARQFMGKPCYIKCRNVALEKCGGSCRFYDFSTQTRSHNYCSYLYDPIKTVYNQKGNTTIPMKNRPVKYFGSNAVIECYKKKASTCISNECVAPPCDQWEYSAVVSHQYNSKATGSGLELCPETAAVLVLHYRDPFAVTYIEEKLQYNFQSYVANVGGLLGLYCGISILSLAQLIHFWILKPLDLHCWKKVFKKRVADEEWEKSP